MFDEQEEREKLMFLDLTDDVIDMILKKKKLKHIPPQKETAIEISEDETKPIDSSTESLQDITFQETCEELDKPPVAENVSLVQTIKPIMKLQHLWHRKK